MAVAFNLKGKDYDEIIKEYDEWYEENTEGLEWGRTYSNVLFKYSLSTDENLFFLDKLTEEDLSEYYIIHYISSSATDAPCSLGVIANEKTRRIIIFFVRDVFPKKE